MKHIALIDFHDSFTYNILHSLRKNNVKVSLLQNSEFHIDSLHSFDKIILSPGPNIPDNTPNLLEIIKEFHSKKSILGICLGHQAIAQFFGAELNNSPRVFHGISTEITLNKAHYIFKNLPNKFSVGRYHSWLVLQNNFPEELQILAQTATHEIMVISHKKYDCVGIQFHPESILTPFGDVILKNWILN